MPSGDVASATSPECVVLPAWVARRKAPSPAASTSTTTSARIAASWRSP
ncbi:hypothetical protein ACLESD_14230 [Pyxidicoccus sp. 3LFB2]